MPDHGDRYGHDLFTSHPDLIETAWAKRCRRARRSYLYDLWNRQLQGFIHHRAPLLPWSLVLITAVLVAAVLIGANTWSTSRGITPFMVTPPTTTATTPQAGH
jgi:hypothetical protein